MSWFRRKLRCLGSVAYRGTVPPRPQEFKYITQSGVRIVERTSNERAHWEFTVAHPKWGAADIVCLRHIGPPPDDLLLFACGLTDAERSDAAAAGVTVTVTLEGAAENMLRDRKNLLRYLRLMLGDDGLFAMDHQSQIIWSRAMLDDEMQHDADVDVSALYSLHPVANDEQQVVWMHTHGLADLGRFDFDVLNPSDDLQGPNGSDFFRAMGLAIVEGATERNAKRVHIAHGLAPIRLVDAKEFNRRTEPRFAALRSMDDDSHNTDRVVLCDPPGGVFGIGDRIRPAECLTRDFPEGMMFHFSDESTALMEHRARATIGVLRRMAGELSEFEFPTLAKIGYPVDGARDATEREHLWFSVHGFQDGAIDATLENEPNAIARMKAGQRSVHPVDRLTDWMILTPVGTISPRELSLFRRIIERKGELLAMMRSRPAV